MSCKLLNTSDKKGLTGKSELGLLFYTEPFFHIRPHLQKINVDRKQKQICKQPFLPEKLALNHSTSPLIFFIVCHTILHDFFKSKSSDMFLQPKLTKGKGKSYLLKHFFYGDKNFSVTCRL